MTLFDYFEIHGKASKKFLRVFSAAIFFLNIIFLSSCAGQEKVLFRPAPGFLDNFINDTSFAVDKITETKGGPGNTHIPDWLTVFYTAGIEGIEIMNSFKGRYCFIGKVEGSNFDALNKWADNFSLIYDFPKLAAARIEKKMFYTASLYPDDEYGFFFELLVKKAFDTEYTDVFLEDVFWIKKINDEENFAANQLNGAEEVYEFFVFVSIDKILMQAVITNMMNETLAVVTPTRSQNNAIRRLQQNFFEGF